MYEWPCNEKTFKMEGQKDLIINYLPQNLTDDEFKSMFLAIGPLKSCKIIRDHATNYSFGFGFVEYYEAQFAAKAIETLNGFPLQNKKIKVAYSRKGDDVKGTNLYIRGLPQEYKQEDVEKIFTPYGQIVNCRVLIDQATGLGRGVGFVLYAHKNEAKRAIQELNGKVPEGSTRNLSVQFAEEYTLKARPGGHYLPFSSPPMGGQFYQGNNRGHASSRNDFTSDNFDGYGQQCGGNFYSQRNPQYVQQQLDGYHHQPAGKPRYGQIHNNNNYQSNMYNNSRTKQFSTYMPPQPASATPNQEYTLFVYNIGPHSDEISLLQIFSRFGYISKVAVVKDPSTGQNKGYGFVTMTNYHEAQSAITSLNGFRYMGRPLQVSFKS